jgi:hypothetical protein
MERGEERGERGLFRLDCVLSSDTTCSIRCQMLMKPMYIFVTFFLGNNGIYDTRKRII